MYISNPFILQILISSIPAVLVTGLMPILSKPLGLTMIGLGLIFLLLRTGSILGSLLTPYTLKKWAPHKIGFFAEIINCAISLLILLSTSNKHFVVLFIACGLLKGTLAGIVNVLRFSWLRRLPDLQKNSHLTLLANSLYQSAYAIVGLLLLLSTSTLLAKTLLVIDALTSLLGACLFWSLKKYGITALEAGTKISLSAFSLLVATPARRLLLLTDILICCAMAGANIMLVKYGVQFFGTSHGYAIALILYGLFYLAGGKLLQFKSYQKIVSLNIRLAIFSLLCMLAALLLMPIVHLKFLAMILFAVLFLFYPIAYLQVQNEWFRLSTPEEAAQISATQLVYSQSIWAIGEIVYSVLNYDNILRASFLLIMIFLVPLYPAQSRS